MTDIKVNSIKVNTPKQAKKIIKKSAPKKPGKISSIAARLSPENYSSQGSYKGRNSAEHNAFFEKKESKDAARKSARKRKS